MTVTAAAAAHLAKLAAQAAEPKAEVEDKPAAKKAPAKKKTTKKD